MSSTLLTTLMLIFFIAICEGCAWKNKQKKRQALHNYPIFKGADCPINKEEYSYDQNKIKIRAKQLGMRPVDYLHAVNNKRWKPNKRHDEVNKLGKFTLE